MTPFGTEARTLDGLLYGGAITTAQADSIATPCPTARNHVDMLLHDLCMQGLGEAADDRAPRSLRRFSDLFLRDREGFNRCIPGVVASALSAALVDLTKGNAVDRARQLLKHLGGPAATDREHSLTLFTRVIAQRVRDGYMHPYCAAAELAWPDVYDWDNLDKPEIATMRESVRVEKLWPAGRAVDRSGLEQVLRSALDGITYPIDSPPRPAPATAWPGDEYLEGLGRAMYAVATLESYVLFEMLSLCGGLVDAASTSGKTSHELGEMLSSPALLVDISDERTRSWLRAAGAALKELAMRRDPLLHTRPAISDGRRRLHRYHFNGSGRAYLQPIEKTWFERIVHDSEAHRAHLVTLRALCP